MKPDNSSMALDHDSAQGAYLMNVERDKCFEHPINNNACDAVFSEEETLECPIKNITSHSALTEGKCDLKEEKGGKKSLSSLKDTWSENSIINNITSHSVLAQGKFDVLKYSRNNRDRFEKSPSFVYEKKRGNSHDSLQYSVEPLLVAGQTSLDQSNEVHSFDVLENKVERVQVMEDAASVEVAENVLIEMTSNHSLGDFAREESKFDEIKGGVDVEVSVKGVKIPEVFILERPRNECVSKKLLILDVNGLLADIVSYVSVGYQANVIVSGKSVFKRPFCDDFLRFCFEKFNVGVWSSRTRRNVNELIDSLFGDSRHKLLFCWDQSHCTNTGFTTVENRSKPLFLKELKKIWEYLDSINKGEYDESNTLLLDDSPYKAICNPMHTAIFPRSYGYKDIADSSLGPEGNLRVYLERLAEAQNVQEYVARHPFGQRAITESDPSWGFYSKIANADSCHSKNVAVTSVTCQP
ncbi:unnamed protein product [Dovyalis caffra]|uniref:Mitochondrial import inner membrane translocase subunit TIM50 n=1 Tax=Dovyalis caffra TaxID=77055 RepID=A0AAV1QQG4_9ROSI|nr:unnamed protein product [Dovyalis caffra]